MVIQDTFSELWLTFDPHWLIAATCLYANDAFFFFRFLERRDGVMLLNVISFFFFFQNPFLRAMNSTDPGQRGRRRATQHRRGQRRCSNSPDGRPTLVILRRDSPV